MEDYKQNSEGKGLLTQILAKREALGEDLHAKLDSLPDESLLANIESAAERINRAMFTNEPLVIFGHDDPDGVTSTYILYQFFDSCGYQKHQYFIPNRNIEPHGIQQTFIDFVARNKLSLAISVDNGIASYDGVEKLKALGCDTIIVDHHLIQPEQLPTAYTIVNPQLPESMYPYKSLSGVGVVLMLIRYLGRMLGHNVPLSAFFWASVGSLADKVAMTGINRVLVRHVLENWSELKDQTVDFLMRNYLRIGGMTDFFNFIQNTAKLIANGREEHGQHAALRFMLQRGKAKAELFQLLEAQKNQWEMELNRVFIYLDSVSAGFEGHAFIYFDDEDLIPYSLLGTAATYILGKLGIPTIMLKLHNGDIVCEGRCGDGLNMVDAFRFCRAHLKQYGGHPRAAGFTLVPEEYDGFIECYNQYLSDNMMFGKSDKCTEPDAVMALEDLNMDNWRDMELLLPFGMQNPEPRILIRKTTLKALQQNFSLESITQDVQDYPEIDVLVYWKGFKQLRILSCQENSDELFPG
jgi:single-stranded-DNA-specific exonuclease